MCFPRFFLKFIAIYPNGLLLLFSMLGDKTSQLRLKKPSWPAICLTLCCLGGVSVPSQQGTHGEVPIIRPKAQGPGFVVKYCKLQSHICPLQEAGARADFEGQGNSQECVLTSPLLAAVHPCFIAVGFARTDSILSPRWPLSRLA